MKKLIVVALLVVSCAGLDKGKAYQDALEDCLHRSLSCEEYVACRKGVADQFGRPFSGSCEPGP